MAGEAVEVEALTLQQLQDEVWFWRGDAAARAFFALADLRAAAKAFASEPSEVGSRRLLELSRRVRGALDPLKEALSGEYYDRCEACQEFVRPGQAVISDVDCGEMHAACCASAGPDEVRPGDFVPMNPESIVWEGDGPKPAGIYAHAAGRLYDHAGLLQRLAEGRALLASLEPQGAADA